MANYPILVIEDDPGTVEVIRASISGLGYPLEHAGDGQKGLACALNHDLSALILDVNLPGLSGFEVLRRVREQKPALPILMLTCRAEEVDKVLGLELGADDYLGKPFGVRELTARVNALLRRAHAGKAARQEEQDRYRSGSLELDYIKRNVVKNGRPVELTALEYDILAFLAQNAGRPFSREEIVDNVWQYRGANYQKSVTVLIKRIRTKIEEDPENPKLILTERGVGYRMAEGD